MVEAIERGVAIVILVSAELFGFRENPPRQLRHDALAPAFSASLCERRSELSDCKASTGACEPSDAPTVELPRREGSALVFAPVHATEFVPGARTDCPPRDAGAR
jgi:hypothetical protein